MTLRLSDPFITPPLAAGAWRVLDTEELAMTVEALGDTCALREFRGGPQRARCLPLPFYGEDILLLDLEGAVAGGTGSVAFVLTPDSFVLVEGSSPPIHDLSRTLGLQGTTDPAVALAFLRFFTGCVWADGGPFVICDTPADCARWVRARPAALAMAPPVRLLDAWGAFEATLMYDGHMFRSVFQIAPEATGMIEMVDDEELAGPFPSRLSFRPPFRIAEARAGGRGHG